MIINNSLIKYDLKWLNSKYKQASLDEIIHWVCAEFGSHLAMTTSFQASGMVLIDHIRKISPKFPIYFIDTKYHFPETLEFKDRIVKEWDLNVTVITSDYSKVDFEKRYGEHLYFSDPDKCCKINKVLPLERIRKDSGIGIWMSAIRRDQAKSRADYDMFMYDEDGYVSFHPMINWTKDDVWKYIWDNKLPFHPLYDQGYTSIGCFPKCCTDRNIGGESDRAGRWRGREKTECGLHVRSDVGLMKRNRCYGGKVWEV